MPKTYSCNKAIVDTKPMELGITHQEVNYCTKFKVQCPRPSKDNCPIISDLEESLKPKYKIVNLSTN